MAFLAQLRRRKVIRTAIAWLAGAWLVLQVADTILPYLGAPDWIMRALIFASAIGFPFALVISWKYDLTAEGLQPAGPDDVATSPRSGRRLDLFVTAAMAIAIVVLVVDNYVLDQFASNDRRSIAVLPLASLTPGEDNESFTGGMHDEILSSLASIASLKVISRTSVLAYSDTTKNLREIGAELDVATILEGTVRRSEDTVRIDVQLIDAETDEQIWSEAYDRDLSVANILAIQGDIAHMVSDSLLAQLTPSESEQLDVIPTQNLQAYEYYLAGINLVSAPLNRQYITTAMRHFESAVEADPGFTLAWVELADTHVSLSMGNPDTSGQQVALDILERAGALDSGIPQADIVQGRIASLEGDHSTALAFLESAERALAGDARLHREKGRAYQVAVQLNESAASYEQAVALDPLDPLARTWLARIYGKLRDHDRAVAHAQTALEFNPTCNYCRWTYGAMRLYRGDDAVSVIDALQGERGWGEHTDQRSFYAAFLAHVLGQDYVAARELIDVWERFHGDRVEPIFFEDYRAYLQSVEEGPGSATAFYAGRLEAFDSALAENPDDLSAVQGSAEANAWLGNREAAVAGAERILSGDMLQPGPNLDFWISDEILLPAMLYILAPAKDKDLLLTTLENYFVGPGHWSIEALQRYPLFDYLQDDPRWDALYEKYRRPHETAPGAVGRSN